MSAKKVFQKVSLSWSLVGHAKLLVKLACQTNCQQQVLIGALVMASADQWAWSVTAVFGFVHVQVQPDVRKAQNTPLSSISQLAKLESGQPDWHMN